MNYTEKRASQLDGGHRHSPDWLQPHFDLEDGKNLPSPTEVSAFLMTYPVFRNKQRAGQVAERLKQILFFYQKSDSVSRFERSRLLKEREKNLKKVKEWDKISVKLEKGLAKGLTEVDKQDREITKLKERLSRAVAGKVEDEGLIREEDLEDDGWGTLLQNLMSKKDEFSNEDVRVKMSLMELMDGLGDIREKQVRILDQNGFGTTDFVSMVGKYIDKGERDYERYLDELSHVLRENVELERLANESSFGERQLKRAVRRESQVKHKRQTLDLKKNILDIMEKMKVDYPEGYEQALKKLDFEILEGTKETETEELIEIAKEAIKSSQKDPYNRHKNLDHMGKEEMEKIMLNDRMESDRKIKSQRLNGRKMNKPKKSKMKTPKKIKNANDKNEKGKKEGSLEKENNIEDSEGKLFDVKKIRKIDRVLTQERQELEGRSEKKKNGKHHAKTGGKGGSGKKLSRFVYTPRKCKSIRQRQKEFNEKIVNRIKKITNKYV